MVRSRAMPSIPVVVTAPATVEGVNVARPAISGGTLDCLIIAPVAAEPLFLSIWAGTGNAGAITATLNAATRFGGGAIPIKDTASVVPLGFPLPHGATIRISTAADGTGAPAAAKVCAFYWT